MTASFPPIRKPRRDQSAVGPNLDYEKLRAGLDWEQAYDELDWLPGGALNIAHEAIDRHAAGPLRDKVAMLWTGKDGQRESYTFGQMKEQSDRFANLLVSLGVERGDRVFLFMDRVPETYFAFFGTLKVGAIACPVFSGFGLDPVRDRMRNSGAKVLVTQPEHRRKIGGVVHELFELQHIVVVNKDGRDPEPLDTADLSYEEEMAKASPSFSIAPTSQLDYSVMHYTSGTTGRPRAVLHRHQAVVQQRATARWALDLRPEDVFWCTADPGWVTGTAYGMVAPWAIGATQVVYEGGFAAGPWYELIMEHRVTVWYTAPTAIRMLMNAGKELPRGYDLSSLRHLSSVGEPLSPEAVVWGRDVLGAPFHDTWWQTEAGAIMCANYPSVDVRPGSMGTPIPGVELAILDQDYDRLPVGASGQLAVRPGWPAMFAAYGGQADMYNARFKKGWYITGDTAWMDEDGYYWFAGRADGR